MTVSRSREDAMDVQVLVWAAIVIAAVVALVAGLIVWRRGRTPRSFDGPR